MCSFFGFSQGLAVASALVDISQQMPVVYKEKSGAVRNRKQQPPAQPGTCIWCWGQDSLWARSGVPEPSARREQAGRRRGAGQKTGNPRIIHLLCMFTSFLWQFLPSLLQHLTFYFRLGNNWFNYRSGVIQLLLEEAGVERVRELRMTLRFTCGKLSLGLSQLCKKQRCSVYK